MLGLGSQLPYKVLMFGGCIGGAIMLWFKPDKRYVTVPYTVTLAPSSPSPPLRTPVHHDNTDRRGCGHDTRRVLDHAIRNAFDLPLCCFLLCVDARTRARAVRMYARAHSHVFLAPALGSSQAVGLGTGAGHRPQISMRPDARLHFGCI